MNYSTLSLTASIMDKGVAGDLAGQYAAAIMQVLGELKTAGFTDVRMLSVPTAGYNFTIYYNCRFEGSWLGGMMQFKHPFLSMQGDISYRGTRVFKYVWKAGKLDVTNNVLDYILRPGP